MCRVHKALSFVLTFASFYSYSTFSSPLHHHISPTKVQACLEPYHQLAGSHHV